MRFLSRPLAKFIYWIEERYKIQQRRNAGQLWPWTKDKILRENFFTNPYREMDKTTVWFANNLRNQYSEAWQTIWVCAAFRWFNSIRTGQALLNSGCWDEWDPQLAHSILTDLNKTGPIFGGAYIIKIENGRPKLDSCIDQITKWWDAAYEYEEKLATCTTLQEAHRHIKAVKHLGGFMAYEIICDLRYTDVLDTATDINSWCFVGPGAKRGFLRLTGGNIESRTKMDPLPHDHMDQLRDLREYINLNIPGHMPRFEMREVEHSLCEFDKYARIWQGTGNMRSKRIFSPRK